MSYLRLAAIAGALLSAGCIGIAIGCTVNGDRRGVGTLALGVASCAAAGAVVFWLL